MIVYRQSKPTITAVEIYHGDIIRWGLLNGNTVDIELLDSGAEILHTTLKQSGVGETGAMTVYRFWADCVINGESVRLEREVGTQRSFYEPWVIAGVRIWLDAVDAIFTFIHETHAPCRLTSDRYHHLPDHRHARLALQDATARICPEPLSPWCPLSEGGLRIEDCYRGEDCWLGAYDGASAHGGLDINHPKGTPLYAPIDLDNHFLDRTTDAGSFINRWRGVRQWADGSQWVLSTSHLTRMTTEQNRPIKRSEQFAEAAGTWVGVVEHSHFGFLIFDRGELVRLDPWILFWQMYQDQH